MRMFIIMVFAINIFCAGIGALSTSEQETTLNSTPLKRSLAATTTKKSLRMQKADDANGFGSNGDMHDEERVNFQGLSPLAVLDKKIGVWSRANTNANLKIWAKDGIDPDKMFFVRLRLSRARHDIDKNKKIIQWFRYINEYRRVWGENMFSNKKMYGTLKFSIPEANLALMLQSMDDIQDVQELAKIMKSHLYKMWKDGKKTPDTIAQFLKIPNSKPMNTEFDPRYKILEEFTEVFNGENGKKLIRSNTMP